MEKLNSASINKLIQLRKELHQYPEVSSAEIQTARRIKAFIQKEHPGEIIDQIGGNGFVVVYEYTTDGPSIMIRCELDALPIQETNDFSYQSKNQGVSHKCGHDGHMAIVTGLVLWLKNQTFKKGKVILLFQPAEETGKGAFKILEDQRFRELKIDYAFALHNIPKVALHTIVLMKKGFSAEVQSFSISIIGKEAHASEPENGINPAMSIAAITKAFDSLNQHDSNDEAFSVLTPIYINMGQKSYGISPAKGTIHYTVRTWTTEKMNALKNEMETICHTICQNNKLDFEIKWFEHFPASNNDTECNKFVLEAVLENNLKILHRPSPFKFGEDFGWFSKEYKAAMFGIGAGVDCAALHHADYDFPDAIIETGVKIFSTIIQNILEYKR